MFKLCAVSERDRQTPLTIGLTGGIGSGKSTVAELFKAHDVHVIDADKIARELVQPGSELLGRIADTFGQQLIGRDGSLDRQQLRRIVFANADKRQQLEALLHPEIHACIIAQIAQSAFPYVIVMIPLLVESGWADWLDRVLVVDASEAARIKRIKMRDGLSEQEIRVIMAAQVSREARLQAADDVIVNNGHRDKLDVEVARLHGKYLEIAKGVICE